MRRNGLRATVVVGLLLVAACSDDDDPSVDATGDQTEEPSSSTTAAADDDPYPSPDDGGDGDEAAASGETVAVGETDLGAVLVDADGMTLYLFTQDKEGTSACTEGCAEAWPPLVADGDPTGGNGVDASKLGTIDRADGTKQVTYAGHPLYTYAADKAAGDTVGQGVGDVWFAVTPEGEPASA